MSVRMRWLSIQLVLVCLLGSGCVSRMTAADLAGLTPDRVPELGKLGAFAGRWEFDAQVRMAGVDEPLHMKATSEASWEADGWCLVRRERVIMEGAGESSGVATWTYDVGSGTYRGVWISSGGSIGYETGWHDETRHTWHFRGTIHGPAGKTTAKGTMTFLDENTVDWTWTEYAWGGLVKKTEIVGTGRRR